MMKTNSKIIIGILTLSLAAGTITPATTYAKQPEWAKRIIEKARGPQNQEQTQKTKATSTPKGNVNFCAFLTEWTSKIDTRIADKETNFMKRTSAREKILEEKRLNRDKKLEENRAKWDANRAEHYKVLLEKAGTDAQKQAIIKFQTAMEAAVQTRKSAVNAAIETYRAEADKLLETRKAAINAVKKTYEDMYNIIIARAKQECESGVNPAENRERVRAELRAAKEKFQAEMKNIAKIDLKPLIEKRHEAIKKVVADFKAAIEKAKTELREAIRPETSSATSAQQ